MGSMPYPCFMLAGTNRFRRSLRRFTWPRKDGGAGCLGREGHNAVCKLDEVEERECEYNGFGRLSTDETRLDPRWPKKCAHCSYEFQADDEWQDNLDRVFTARGGAEYCLRDPMPAGAMYCADWIGEFFRANTGSYRGPQVYLVLPGGAEWLVTGESKTGGGWQVDGTDPVRLTASPSIAAPGYHGWLRNGVLTDDCEGRTYP